MQLQNISICTLWKVIENETKMEFGVGGSHQEIPSEGMYRYYFWNITLALEAQVVTHLE